MINPLALIRNAGAFTESFHVEMEISQSGFPIYSDVVEVDSIQPGDTTSVFFSPFQFNAGHYYEFTATSLLSEDMNANNNLANSTTNTFTEPRVPLALHFTNPACAYCNWMDLGLDSYMAEQNNSVALVRVHVNWPDSHDPMYLDNPTQIHSLVEQYLEFYSVPYIVVDGTDGLLGYPSDFEELIEERKQINSPINIETDWDALNERLRVFVEVANPIQIENRDYRVRVIAAEDGLYYESSGTFEHDIHDQAFRRMYTDQAGLSLSGLVGTYDFFVDCPVAEHWDYENLAAIVYVQEETSGEVLQASTAFLRTRERPLPAPSMLVAMATSPSDIQLTWSDDFDNENFYEIERRIGLKGAWELLYTAPNDSELYSDTGVPQGNTYFYRIRAGNNHTYSPYSSTAHASPFLPVGTLMGVIFEDQNGNGLYEEGVDEEVVGANLVLDDRVSAVSDEYGGYRIEAPFGGSWNNLTVGARLYQAKMVNVDISYVDVTHLDVPLIPIAIENLAVREMSPPPIVGNSQIMVGGELHRYYRVIDTESGEPAPNIEVSLTSEQLPGRIFTYSSQSDGLVDIVLSHSQLDDAVSTVHFQVDAIEGAPLAPEDMVEFTSELSPYTARTVFSTEKGASVKFVLPKGKASYSSVLTLESLWLPGYLQPSMPNKVTIGRKYKTGAYVAGGISHGFASRVEGAHAISGGLGYGISGEAGIYSETEQTYSFNWPPVNEDEAMLLYLCFADGRYLELDKPLEKLLEVIAAIKDFSFWFESALVEDGIAFGLEGSVNIFGTLGAAGATMPIELGADRRLGVDSGYFSGHSKNSRLSRSMRYVGGTAEIRYSSHGGVGFSGPSMSGRDVGVEKLTDEFFLHNTAHASTFTTDAYGIYDPQDNLITMGARGSAELIEDGHGWELSQDYFLTHPHLVRELAGSPNTTFRNIAYSLAIGLPFNISDIGLMNNIVVMGDLVTNYQNLVANSEQGGVLAGESPVLHYVQSQNNPIDKVSREFTIAYDYVIGLGLTLSGEDWHSHAGVSEKGVMLNGELLPLEVYPEIPVASEQTLQEIVQRIILECPQYVQDIAFLTKDFGKTGNGQKSQVLWSLADNRSSLEIDPTFIPPGIDLGVAYWQWGLDDETQVKYGLNIKPEQAAHLKRASEQKFGMAHGIGGFHQFEPEGTSLLGTANLSLAYEDSEIVGFDENELAIYYEDKLNHRFIYVGGVVNPDSNTVTAQISELRMFTLAPRLPFGAIALSATQDSILADGISTTTIYSSPILNNDGTAVADGSLYSVYVNNGSLVAADVDTSMPGIQVASAGGTIEFDLQASHIAFPCFVYTHSLEGSAAGADTVTFLDVGVPDAPQGVQLCGTGMNVVELAWERNTEPDIGGYRVYFDFDSPDPPYSGPAAYFALPSPVDVGNDTTVTIMGLDLSKTYYLTITAYDLAGNESPYANPIVNAATTQVNNGPPPRALSLMQNYPNPFNPTTKIQYSLPRTGRVSLKIYDIRGRIVKVLVDGQVPAGRHEETWRGDDSSGRQVASGVYLYLLQTDQETRTRKMAVVR